MKKLKKAQYQFFPPLILIIAAIVSLYVIKVVTKEREIVYSSTGVLTEISKSCSGRVLKDYKVVRKLTACDGGNSIVVDYGLRIDTGGGAYLSNEKDFSNKDLNNAYVGDKIKVDYILDEGVARTKCVSCGVTIIEAGNLPQID